MAEASPVATQPEPDPGEAAPRDDRRLRADARRNRASILAAAEAVFTEGGPEGSVDEIARRAGVGVGTVYRHFPTKEALLRAIVVSRIELLVGDARQACAAGDPGEAFFAFLGRLGEEVAGFKALAETMAAAGFDIEAAHKDVAGDLMAALAELLTRAQSSGAVRPDVTLADVKMLLGGLSQKEIAGPDPSPRNRYLALVSSALRPPGAPSASYPAPAPPGR